MALELCLSSKNHGKGFGLTELSHHPGAGKRYLFNFILIEHPVVGKQREQYYATIYNEKVLSTKEFRLQGVYTI